MSFSVAAMLVSCVTPSTAAVAPDSATGPGNVIVGKVRVQLLSDSLVRLELKGPEGFEDRVTFHVVNRRWPGTAFSTNNTAREVLIRTAHYTVRVPHPGDSLNGIRIEDSHGKVQFHDAGAPLRNSRWLPGPRDNPRAWWFADTPRLIPPPWGLTPAPAGAEHPKTSGWDLGNDAPDIYVFLPRGDYRRLRRDFLKLTGPTEMPPLFAFGAFDSRWYDYTEAAALRQIADYRARHIPLDVLVIDTGWRQNASTGYQPNTNLFPDLTRFFREAHARHVRVMFNDHPEPKTLHGLDPAELDYRYAGLSKLLNEGLDFWWYDRNWMVALKPPEPNLKKEVWGMRLYHDITQKVRPDSRPLIMANVDGIDNGIRKRPPDVASHRFPIQWTGDIGPGFDYLRRGVENAVYSGVQALFPYMSEDLGGHTSNPTPEQYIRWIEYGALSPVYRPHCTHNLMRMPWTFGPAAGRVARRFLNMRYRLLPVFYAAAHLNYETGEPLLRRLDLDYPFYREASRNDEYLLGKGILVAPVLHSSVSAIPATWLKTGRGEQGLSAEYFANPNLAGAAALTRTDSFVDFNWGRNSPAPVLPKDYFSARWTGTIQVPRSAGNVVLSTVGDDGARVWIDGKPVINAWGAHDAASTEASAALSPGRPHRLRVEYQELTGDAVMRLEWRSATTNRSVARALWIPPGTWINAWTGDTVSGPATVTYDTPLDQIPIYIRSGTILPLAPGMQYTGEQPWNPITLDLYPASTGTQRAILYEDDTFSTAYRTGQFRTTAVNVTADHESRRVRIAVAAATGTFAGALRDRAWVLRLHRPPGWPANLVPTEALSHGETTRIPIRRLTRTPSAMPFGDPAGAPDGAVFELKLPAAPVASEQQIDVSFSTTP